MFIYLLRLRAAQLICALTLALQLPAGSETVQVKHPEGTLHGYLLVRDSVGKRIGTGELVQVVHGSRVTSRLVFRFLDGSIDDEIATFTQRGTFHLLTDHHVQKGPSFPQPSDISIDVQKSEVTQRSLKDGKVILSTTHMDMPADLANGWLTTLLTNADPSADRLTVSYLAATPKPRMVKLVITPAEEHSFSVGPLHHRARCFVIHIDVGGIAGVIAPLIGKQPKDIEVWIEEGDAPAFIRQAGPFVDGGQVWSTELTSPVWGKE